jgi:ribosomal protein L11 methyltransferase
LKAQQAISFVCDDDTTGSAALSAGLLSDALSELGATSVTVTDQRRGTDAETPVFRHHKNSPTWRGGKGVADPAFGRTDALGVVDESTWRPSQLWQSSLVTATFPPEWAPASVAEMVQLALGLDAAPTFSVADVDEGIDWVKTVQESWAPIRVGDVLVRFPWHDAAAVESFYCGAADAAAEAAGVAATPYKEASRQLVLEGGVAFGTGEHPTTVLCLEWLQAQVPGKRVLDYGAGSGILGLASLALGASMACGVEVDRDAIGASHRNAQNNGLPFTCYLPPAAIADTPAGGAGMGAGMGSQATLYGVTTASPDECTPLPHSLVGSFDVCVANILAGPLTQLAPTMAQHCRAGAGLALSGVLADQGDKVCAAYRPFFPDMQVSSELEGWLLLTGTRAASKVEIAVG